MKSPCACAGERHAADLLEDLGELGEEMVPHI